MGYRSSRFVYFGGSDKVIRVWDRQEQKVQNSLTGHRDSVQSLALTTDDQRVVSGSASGDVILHSLKHGTRSALMSPLKQV